MLKRIGATVAATAMASVVLFVLLGALGRDMTPQWRVEPFTDHIAVESADTAIRATDLQTPQEGTYQTKETHITVPLAANVTVNAIVREPIGAPDGHPACLLMHGSGTGKSAEAYGDIANAMASAGITTLVPDKRLDNYSALHRDYVSSAHDYARSLETLRQWPGVDPAKTGLYAESEGTWIATVLTQEHQDIAFAILTSSPVVSGRQQMTLAATSYLTTVGAPDAVKGIIPRLTSLSLKSIGLEYADFDAAQYRTSLTMPLLINYGVRDSAMPIEQGARLLIQAANEAGNDNVTLRYFDANHQMRTGSNATVPGLPLEEHYTHDLEDWINAVAAGTTADGWATPMIAGAQPNQRIAAPLSTKPTLIKTLDVLVGGIASCLLLALAAIVGALILLIVGMSRSPQDSRRFAGPLRMALAVNTILAAGMTGIFLAYLFAVVRDAITLTNDSTLLARYWQYIVIGAIVSLIAFAWLLVECVFAVRARRRQESAWPLHAHLADTHEDTHDGHRNMAGIRNDHGKASVGFGHVAVATCVMLSAALSLALLAFWGLFG
ncbi:alpha/beta hydrolase [Bifidobacterium dentium]|uniref:alpha/beta hydrolase family protein n=1 Tax=Bifidobacterium dentium TaxID=1689 RepID=UPI001ADB1FA8|nr:alpha/beta hydrolase [Bifidobacterium dentium]